MIRVATKDDLPRLMEIAAVFYEMTVFKDIAPRDDVGICAFLEALIDDDDGVIFVGEFGCIGGNVGSMWAAPNVKLGVEVFWFGAGEGRALREAFEQWAYEKGCKAVMFSTLGQDTDLRAEKSLKSSGYAKTEQYWIRTYSPC